MINDIKNSFSLQLKPDSFAKVDKEKIFRSSNINYRRKYINLKAITSLIILALILILAFIVPLFYPYSYSEQLRNCENLKPFQFSSYEMSLIDNGTKLFPHVFGTDNLGRDMAARVLTGARISMFIGVFASLLVMIIGSIYGAISGYFGGALDLVMMRIVDIIYTLPDILIVILLSVSLKVPLNKAVEHNHALSAIGANLISVFIAFGLLYWGSAARIVRGQIMSIKQCEFITAARAYGASSSRIITKHLIPNCIDTIIVIATLQVPTAIFTESYLSFLGLGVSAPMPSLGSLAADAVNGISLYPYRLIAPAAAITIIIFAFNMLGDGLRDMFDVKEAFIED
ncbi:MAG: ABC transporter permease [Bacillota bacterium]|nr:ABC transporter permease [Bacillota bacterium]